MVWKYNLAVCKKRQKCQTNTMGGIQKAGSSVDQARITAQAAFFISER